MISKTLNVQPWHKVVRLRDDLKSGELALSMFAADLYEVSMGQGRKVYLDPKEFFALTYPTFNLREMVKDVLLRLLGKNDKAVRLLELTYGGGKTHSLVTLYHLAHDPEHLPDLPAVQEFRQHAGGIVLPKARVSTLCFDKLDIKLGMAVRAPDGSTKQLFQPWSILAYQIAGRNGLRTISGDEKERESPPAENVLKAVLEMPQKEGLATLVLIDEVLMYAREKVVQDPAMRLRLQDFFQCLTQAATKVDRACIVASLLATEPRKSDQLGKEIVQELYNVVRRQAEQGIQPVEKQDVAEVLRRRFFTPESIAKRETFRTNVVSALEGIQALDDQTRKGRQAEEDRYLASFPFHPDLTEAFYTKWTSLESFQRTRGVLRTFAMALRDAEKWDTSPLIGPNVLLNAPGKRELSDAARELAAVAASEEYEGKKQAWNAILEGELDKARDVQKDFPLQNREMEQAVVATFLHSQPAGQRALSRDLLVLLGASKPDRIELSKALIRWTEVSWFLDDSVFGSAKGELPKSWRLGAEPNLNQMHHQAVTRVSPERIEPTLNEMIAKERRLSGGQASLGIKVHNLPKRPSDVQDDGDFHFAILGPSAACESGNPSKEAAQFINQTTPDKPRTYRNAIIVATPSTSGLALLRDRVRDYLGWQEVGGMSEAKDFSEPRRLLLAAVEKAAKDAIPEAMIQAYNVVVTLSPKPERQGQKDSEGVVEAFRITPTGDPLFDVIKAEKRSRIMERIISPDALLPDQPYNLWEPGETSRRAANLIDSFAQFPHLPKMLRRKDIVDTLALGCQQGYFVLRVPRPDGSARTIWRFAPGETDLTDKGLEVVLPEAAELTYLDPALLAPGKLTGLWPPEAGSLGVGQILDFFDGKHVIKVPKEGGYEEPFPVPHASEAMMKLAISEAVQSGTLWLIALPASLYREPVPAGILSQEASVRPAPRPMDATALLPQNLSGAWENGKTTALALSAALSAKEGVPLPWAAVSGAISSAVQSRLLELDPNGVSWPCEWPLAGNLRLRLPRTAPITPLPLRSLATSEVKFDGLQMQSLLEELPDLIKASAGLDLSFVLRLEIGKAKANDEEIAAVNEAWDKARKKLKPDGKRS